MKKKYSKPSFSVLVSTTIILCLVGLFNLSGCFSESPCITTISIDDQVFDPQSNVIDIEGPDELLPCDMNGSAYKVTVFTPGSVGAVTNVGNMSGAKWVASGNIEISGNADYNPVTIVATSDSGSGTLELVTTNRGSCVNGNKTLATKSIDISFAGAIGISSTVCNDPATKIGAGDLQLNLGAFVATNIVWSIDDASVIFKQDSSDATICHVSNTPQTFTASVEISIKDACNSVTKLSFPITVDKDCVSQ